MLARVTEPAIRHPLDGGRLAGKVAVVTGASSGIGRATLQLFAREGAKVVGVARREALLEEVLAEILAEGGEGVVVAADLSAERGSRRAVAAAIDAYARIDVLVNCAGVGHSFKRIRPDSMSPLHTTSITAWNEVLAINLGSAFHMLRLVVPIMRHQQEGSIINVASVSGFTGLDAAHAYTAAKGALINLTRSLALTYVRDGIRSNVVAPGIVATPMVSDVLDVFEDETRRWWSSPIGRPAKPDEIAYGCLYFASDESTYCNGSVLVIDGGTSARAFPPFE